MKKFIWLILFFPLFVFALENEVSFYIDPDYDLFSRDEIKGKLVLTTNNFYFYVDEDWWEKFSEEQKKRISEELYNLSSFFEYKIYPSLKNNFGEEPRPGIDGEERVYILIHPLKEGVGGYVQERDLFPKIKNKFSNEKEIIFLNSDFILSPHNKIVLTHEFFHLISLNQKLIFKNLKEDIWLEEGRADYIPVFLELTQNDDSLPRERIKTLSRASDFSLVVWKNKKENYALAFAFLHYLIDQYGQKILIDSFKSDKVGIDSINFALEKNNVKKEFYQIFEDWLATLMFPDCRFGPEFCYKEKIFREIQIVPKVYYLPKENGVYNFYTHFTYFQPKFIKILTANEKLKIEIEGEKDSDLEIPYFLCDYEDKCQIKKLILNQEKKGKIEFSDFGKNYSYLILAPFEKGKNTGFSEKEREFELKIKITTGEGKETQDFPSLFAELLKNLISSLNRNYPPTISSPQTQKISCEKIERDLYFGLRNDPQVKCLQEFLAQDKEIYPEGKVTGNFLWLTKKAVIKFQEKYKNEILKPFGLQRGTGYVGYFTRLKINQLISGE